jgi:hypothetical protein
MPVDCSEHFYIQIFNKRAAAVWHQAVTKLKLSKVKASLKLSGKLNMQSTKGAVSPEMSVRKVLVA